MNIKNLTSEEKQNLAIESTNSAILDQLARLKSDYVLIMNIVRNPYTGFETLHWLAHNIYYPIVLRYIARHPNTSEETLDFLAHSVDHTVRTAVAGNIKTRKQTRYRLAKDSNYEVRCAAEASLQN